MYLPTQFRVFLHEVKFPKLFFFYLNQSWRLKPIKLKWSWLSLITFWLKSQILTGAPQGGCNRMFDTASVSACRHGNIFKLPTLHLAGSVLSWKYLTSIWNVIGSMFECTKRSPSIKKEAVLLIFLATLEGLHINDDYDWHEEPSAQWKPTDVKPPESDLRPTSERNKTDKERKNGKKLITLISESQFKELSTIQMMQGVYTHDQGFFVHVTVTTE